ncbi:glycosyltransferase family 2 protein, partial [bacterium]|nr:glycosyltransferase family 2 protein [bacterium]
MNTSSPKIVDPDWVNPSETKPQVSIVVPVYNEVESLPYLIETVSGILQTNDFRYEIICVDDGSRDGSTELLRQLARQRDDLRAVLLRRNYGQTAAMAAGFEYACGVVVVTLDGDLQNDPNDIPQLLSKLNEGYDLVSGWR